MHAVLMVPPLRMLQERMDITEVVKLLIVNKAYVNVTATMHSSLLLLLMDVLK